MYLAVVLDAFSRRAIGWELGETLGAELALAALRQALAESFMKTLKSEEVALWHYRDLAQARASIGHFLEQIYNRRRLHSALGYLPPVEFEAAVASAERREPGRVRYGFSQA